MPTYTVMQKVFFNELGGEQWRNMGTSDLL